MLQTDSSSKKLGLEPTTLKLRASCSTYWASRARHAVGKRINDRNKNKRHIKLEKKKTLTHFSLLTLIRALNALAYGKLVSHGYK